MSATVEEVNHYIGNCMKCDWHTEEFEMRDMAREAVLNHNAERHHDEYASVM